MDFFPLTLGIPKPRANREKTEERKPGVPRLTYETWREGLSGPEEDTDAHPAADVLSRLVRGDPTLPPRPWVILGEPGSGKTSLLEHWHATWLRALPRLCLGMRVPVLVRLHDVPREVLAGDPATVADTLWAKGVAAGQGAARSTVAAGVFALPARVFTPVWLLDSLDELAAPPITSRGLWDMLRALPGEAVLTCRTAVFQPARTETAGRVGKEWRLLGLKPEEEQAQFLARAYAAQGWDPSRASEAVRELNVNPALRPLAAVPLLLRLVAEAGPRLTFPATRAEFYDDATNALWARRLNDRPELFDLAPERDAALAALAAVMDLATMEAAGPEALRRAGMSSELREAMHRSGLLHFDNRRGRVSFPHLTFQEFHLARALLGRPFGKVLRERWTDPRNEETLALLIALHAGAGHASMVEAELRGFVAAARADHARNPQRLRSLGRSPLRTVLHLLARAAVSPEVALPIPLLTEHVLMRNAVASDRRVPPAALAELAGDNNPEVRQEVTRNSATPPTALAELAADDNPEVRRWVTRNDATPQAALAELASDDNPEVRRWVARNPATPQAALAELASDDNPEVRRWAALNPAMPSAALAELASDEDPWVRRGVAANAATPPAALAALAGDDNPWVRRGVAENAAMPSAALAELASDDDPKMRRGVAANAAMPPTALAELAGDDDPEVRQWVARNAATPPTALAELASDDNPWVRQGVAGNAATPPTVLAALAGDGDPGVRRGVGLNAATPPTVLAVLAGDGDLGVRQWVGLNAATPQAALAVLAGDGDPR